MKILKSDNFINESLVIKPITKTRLRTLRSPKGVAVDCGLVFGGDEVFNGVWRFNSEPLDGQNPNVEYTLEIRKGLVIDWFGTVNEPISSYVCDEEGNPNKDVTDESLTKIMPSAIWDFIQKSDDEYIVEDIPFIVKKLVDVGVLNYDGVVFNGIGEGNDGQTEVDDYFIFSDKQIVTETIHNR